MSAPGNAGAAIAGSSEISRVFPSQAAAVGDILCRVERATAVDILALRGLELPGLRDPLLRAERTAPAGRTIAVRVLLLDAESGAARRRAAQVGAPADSFCSEIRLVEAGLREFAARKGRIALEVYRYRVVPAWRLIRVDDIQYVSTLCDGWDGAGAEVYQLAETAHGPLYRGFRQVFEDLRSGARRVV